ncbi:MAG: molybdenum cofactor guanylyltransferase [Desulfobacterales bacterium]|nr:molybdenum cofactor guanylyltransferase [Desulfobacterales bacterium]MDX2512990.1 molybdenum cofactor guanylyltransferase [Desulfobacterales bacterium]
MTQQTFTGIILAGGESKRLNNVEKSNLLVGDKRIIERMMTVFEKLFSEIILVSNHPTTYLEWDAIVVKDIYTKRSSLTGIHSGLFYTKTDHAFIAACDTPFLKMDLIKAIVQHVDSCVDVVIPRTNVGIEPLCAVYSRRSFQSVQTALEQNDLKIRNLFNKLNVKEVPETVLRKMDPGLISFFNINTPEDLEKANRIVNQNGY